MKNFKYFLMTLMFVALSVNADSIHRSDYANVERQKIAQLQNSDFRNPYMQSNVHNYGIQMRNDYEERKAMQEIRKQYRMSNQSYRENKYNEYNQNYGYERRSNYQNMNQYNDIEKDSYGKVVNVEQREQCVEFDRTSGGEQLTGALIGGAIGNQFGSGNGRKVMTATGALVGAGLASREESECSYVFTMTVERRIMVNGERDYEYLSFNSDMPISVGTKIKLNNY